MTELIVVSALGVLGFVCLVVLVWLAFVVFVVGSGPFIDSKEKRL